MEEIHRQIRKAVHYHDWTEVEKLILAGAKDFCEHEWEFEETPLNFELIDEGHEELAILWLDHGYPHYLTTGGRVGSNILHQAAMRGLPRLVERMLKTDIGINDWDEEFHAPLWHAAKNGPLSCVKVLLENCAYPDGNESEGTANIPSDTPLCVAANACIAAILLDAGARANLGPYAHWLETNETACSFNMDREIVSPLTCAALDGRMDVASLLLQHGILLNSQPLRFMALCRGKLEDARELIRLGAHPDGEPGYEPIRVAARAGYADFCKMLLEYEAKLTPDVLNQAVLGGDQECVDLFLEKGDPEQAVYMAARNGSGSILGKLLALRSDLVGQALLGAIAGCRLKLAREMLDRGADPNIRNAVGQIPLMLLYSIARRTETYRFMAVAPSRYHAKWRNGQGWTPMERDFDKGDIYGFNLNRPENWNEIIHLIEDDALAFAGELIGKGADIHSVDNKGRSALWYACSRSWMKSIPWLAGMGLDINDRDSDGNSAFDAGCMSGESFTIEPMLKAGAVVDAHDYNGDTALIKIACEFNISFSLPAIMTLLRFGANPDLENNSGVSLRKLAEREKNLQWAIEHAEKEK